MTIHYSASTGGFYDSAIHGAGIPADAVVITAFRHAQLLELQASGRAIVADAWGNPQAPAPPEPLIADRRASATARAKREAERRIVALVPLWRQSNDNAAIAMAALEFATVDASTIDVTASLVRRASIDAIRSASDLLETAIATMTHADIDALDVADPIHWPAE